MKIPFLNLQVSDAEVVDEIKKVVSDIIDRKDFILGKEVREFETEFAKYIGTKYAVGVSSGSCALFISLKAIGINKDDVVITSPFTFTATGEVIVHCGATPVFIDIDEKTYNIDPQKVEDYIKSKIKNQKSKIRAIIPVHLYGQPADMVSIMEIAQKYNIKVVEDAAQAHGAECKFGVNGLEFRDKKPKISHSTLNTQHSTKKVGSIGDLGCFSFYPTKNLGGYGDGGIITVNDEDLYKKILKFRNHGRVEHYLHQVLGYNARLDNLQAAILLQKFKFIEQWNKNRQQIAQWYNEGLKNVGDLILPFVPERFEHVYHLYVIRTKYRDMLMDYLKQNEIGCAIQYGVPLHLQPAYKNVCEIVGDMKVVEKVSKEVLSLPIYPGLKKEDIDFVVMTIKNFFNKKL